MTNYDLKTVLHWLWVRKEIVRLNYPFFTYRRLVGRCGIEKCMKLFEYARKSDRPIVEIGSFLGLSTIAIASGSDQGFKQKIYAIDPHTKIKCADGINYPNTKRAFLDNLKKSNSSYLIESIFKFSQDAVKGWDKEIGFLFIDGDHGYKEVKRDFEQWTKFVGYMGIVAMDDVGVYEGVSKFFKEVRANPEFVWLEHSLNVDYFRKITDCEAGGRK